MRLRAFFLVSLLLACATPSLAQTADEQVRLDWVQQRGRLLYEIDRAAWVTTDDLRERVPNLAASGIRGWTVERDGGGYSVIFYAGEGDARVAAYRARVENNRVVAAEVLASGARPPLTPLQRRLADARDVVARDVIRGLRFCARASPNLALIPPDTLDGEMDVYVLTPQVQNGVWPAGGHYRVTLSAAGAVLSSRPFTNSCVNLGGDLSGQESPVALYVTHLLDPLPTEIHVFTSLTSRLPLGVGTQNPGRVWWVAGDRIRLETGQP